MAKFREYMAIKDMFDSFTAEQKTIFYDMLDTAAVKYQKKNVAEKNLAAHKEDKTMATTTNKSYDYTATPEELELDKAIKEATEEAEKKIMDIRIELSKKLEALRSEYQEKEAVKREERQAHAWRRRYDALLKEGFSVEQAWEMTMEAFKID